MSSVKNETCRFLTNFILLFWYWWVIWNQIYIFNWLSWHPLKYWKIPWDTKVCSKFQLERGREMRTENIRWTMNNWHIFFENFFYKAWGISEYFMARLTIRVENIFVQKILVPNFFRNIWCPKKVPILVKFRFLGLVTLCKKLVFSGFFLAEGRTWRS